MSNRNSASSFQPTMLPHDGRQEHLIYLVTWDESD